MHFCSYWPHFFSHFGVFVRWGGVGAGGAGTENVFFCSANVREQLRPFLFSWGCSSQTLFQINREKRCLDQDGFPGLAVNGSCKVELNFRSEKKKHRDNLTAIL
jgi:hypothetical protein